MKNPIQAEAEAVLQADIIQLMTHKWGRRLAYTIMHDYGMLDRQTADLSIKDGMTAALHSWRIDGARAVGAAFMQDLQRFAREEYTLMLQEEILRRTALLDLQEHEGTVDDSSE